MKKVFILVLAFAVLSIGSIYAHHADGHRTEKTYTLMGGDYKDGLTLDQINEIDAIVAKYDDDFIKADEEIIKQDNIIKSEMMKGNPNKSKIDAAIDAKSKIETTIEKLQIEMNIAIDEVLGKAENSK